LKDQAPNIPGIVTRTFVIIARNKDIGPKIEKKKLKKKKKGHTNKRRKKEQCKLWRSICFSLVYFFT
jgi:hypothetical protein